jgi:hypothetical protein
MTDDFNNRWVDGRFTHPDGDRVLATSDNGKRAKWIPIGQQPEPGWRLMGKRDMDAVADEIMVAMLEQIAAERAQKN